MRKGSRGIGVLEGYEEGEWTDPEANLRGVQNFQGGGALFQHIK